MDLIRIFARCNTAVRAGQACLTARKGRPTALSRGPRDGLQHVAWKAFTHGLRSPCYFTKLKVIS